VGLLADLRGGRIGDAENLCADLKRVLDGRVRLSGNIGKADGNQQVFSAHQSQLPEEGAAAHDGDEPGINLKPDQSEVEKVSQRDHYQTAKFMSRQFLLEAGIFDLLFRKTGKDIGCGKKTVFDARAVKVTADNPTKEIKKR